MNENIDLTKILEGCPTGTKFYSSIFGEVSFVEIHNCYDKYPIKLRAYNKSTHSIVEIDYAEDGRSSCIFDGECTLFPSKDQRDWSKFERFWDKPKKENPNIERFDPTTLKPFDKVLVKDYRNDIWTASWYSHSANNLDDGWFVCDNTYWHYIIPYNDETKHLVGTKEDCPEYYKWWED